MPFLSPMLLISRTFPSPLLTLIRSRLLMVLVQRAATVAIFSSMPLQQAPISAAGLSSDYVVVGEVIPQGSNTGTTDVPECPGYVIPNGYQLYAVPTGGEAAAAADVFANGYLIPSSDAPSTPAAGQLGLSNPLTRAKG